MRCPAPSFLARSLALVAIVATVSACAGTAPASPTAAKPAAPASTAAAPAAAAPTTAPALTTAAPAAAAPTAAAPAPAAPTAAPPAKVTEYNVTVISDYSGPGAESIKTMEPGRKVGFTWWNDTRGKELGIKINPKYYDGRYDGSVVSSLWTNALASEKPIFIAGYGGADSAALQERLPTDKVPWFSGSIGRGFNRLPNQWLFFAQPTNIHLVVGALQWLSTNWKENRPIRLASLLADGVVSGKDNLAGIQAGMPLLGGKAEFVGAEYVPTMTTDTANAIKRLVDKGADFINMEFPTPPILASIAALKAYKAPTKIMFHTGTGISVVASASSMSELEGYLEVLGLNSATDEKAEGRKIFEQYKERAGVGAAKWVDNSIWGLANVLPALRGVERAAKAVGADKITGEALYNAMFAAPLSADDLLGTLGGLTYTKDAPFPTKGARMRVGTVKDGKHVLATPDWIPVPEIPKW